MRAKTREKDTYFEAGIVQSLENRENLWEKAYKLEFIDTMQSSIIKLLDAKVHAANLLSAFGCKGLHILPHGNDT